MNTPAFGCINLAEAGNVTAPPEIPGYPITNALDWSATTKFKCASLGCAITTGGPLDVDCVGIASHNLAGATVTIETTPDFVTYTTEATFTAGSGTIMVMFPERIGVSVIASIVAPVNLPEIGIFFVGKTLRMPNKIYGGHSPITLSRNTVLRNDVAGAFLGREIRRASLDTSYSFRNIEADWYRQNFEPFVYAAQSQPFFVSWRPDQYPNEGALAVLNNPPQPTNQGQRALMSVDLSVRGYA